MKIFLLTLIISFSAFGMSLSGDDWKNPLRTKTWTPPSATDTLVGRSSTDTLINKTISGSSNTLSNIALGSSVTGMLPIANGGTGSSSQNFVDLSTVQSSIGGAKTFTAQLAAPSMLVNGTAGSGFITLTGQSSNPSAPAAGSLLLHSSTANGFTRLEQDNEAATNLVYGRDNVVIGRNTTGSTIAKGSPVYVSGSSGNVPLIAKAQANSNTTVPAIGIVLDDIANNSFGQIMTKGIITNIDTSAFASSNALFVSPIVAGGLTATRPSGTTNNVQRMGSVLVSGVNGSVLVETAPAVLNMETGTNATTWTGKAIAGDSLALGGTANANAILDVQSTTKAFMPPRMTTSQKNAISGPTNGMTVFDTDLGKLSVYNGSWQTLTNSSDYARLMGAAVVTGCAAKWQLYNSTSFAEFPVQTGCSYALTGSALAPATMLPGFRFASLPAGCYKVEYEGSVGNPNSANVDHFQFWDGTNTALESAQVNSGTADMWVPGISQTICYATTQTNVTLRVRSKQSIATAYSDIFGTTARPGVFKLWYFPL